MSIDRVAAESYQLAVPLLKLATEQLNLRKLCRAHRREVCRVREQNSPTIKSNKIVMMQHYAQVAKYQCQCIPVTEPFMELYGAMSSKSSEIRKIITQEQHVR